MKGDGGLNDRERRLAGLLLSLVAALHAGASDEPGFPVRGRVVDSRTGEPIAKALVSIRAHRSSALTDAEASSSSRPCPLGASSCTSPRSATAW